MKKQLLLGAMILCLAGSMTACSGTSKAAQDNKAQEKETYTLKVSHVQGDNAPRGLVPGVWDLTSRHDVGFGHRCVRYAGGLGFCGGCCLGAGPLAARTAA